MPDRAACARDESVRTLLVHARYLLLPRVAGRCRVQSAAAGGSQAMKVILSPWSVRCSLLQASVRYTHNWYPWLACVEHRLCVSVSIIYISSDC